MVSIFVFWPSNWTEWVFGEFGLVSSDQIPIGDIVPVLLPVLSNTRSSPSSNGQYAIVFSSIYYKSAPLTASSVEVGRSPIPLTDSMLDTGLRLTQINSSWLESVSIPTTYSTLS